MSNQNEMKDSDSEKVPFSVEYMYNSAIDALKQTGIITMLPQSKNPGVIGIDGKEYPVPTLKQLQKVFTQNKILAATKILQG